MAKECGHKLKGGWDACVLPARHGGKHEGAQDPHSGAQEPRGAIEAPAQAESDLTDLTPPPIDPIEAATRRVLDGPKQATERERRAAISRFRRRAAHDRSLDALGMRPIELTEEQWRERLALGHLLDRRASNVIAEAAERLQRMADEFEAEREERDRIIDELQGRSP